MSVNELSQRNGHFFFNSARIVNVARNTEKFGSSVVGPSERRKPRASSSEDGWADGNSFDIGDGGWAVEDTTVGWEWWFKSWLSGFSFQTFNESSFLAANVGASSIVNVHIKIVARSTCVFTQESFFIGLGIIKKVT